MPRKSRSAHRKRYGSNRQNQNNISNELFNQNGGNANEQPQGKVEISQATLNQAGQIAQKFLEQAMTGNKGQTGGSAGSAGNVPASPTQVEGIQNAIVEGAVAGANAGAIAAAEGYSSLKGAAFVGGRRSKGRRRGRKSQNQNQPEQNQKGGMVPGLVTAVETALVPLGLYLGQKALQSRRPGSRYLGKSFDFRRSSRRTRRRR